MTLAGTSRALAVILLAMQAGPASALRGVPAWQHADASRQADEVNGRFLAFGGQFGQLRNSCSSCHQMDGSGDPSGAVPRIGGQTQSYLLQALQDFASGARKSDVMKPVASDLTRSDMRNLSAYYSSLEPAPHQPPAVPVDRGLIEQGRHIAEQGVPKAGVTSCNSCHGGSGTAPSPPFPSLRGQYRGYLESQLRAFKSGERAPASNVMTQVAKHLSEQQMRAVSAYFSSGTPASMAKSE